MIVHVLLLLLRILPDYDQVFADVVCATRVAVQVTMVIWKKREHKHLDQETDVVREVMGTTSNFKELTIPGIATAASSSLIATAVLLLLLLLLLDCEVVLLLLLLLHGFR